MYIESKRKEVVLNERNSPRKGWIIIYLNRFIVSAYNVSCMLAGHGNTLLKWGSISPNFAETIGDASDTISQFIFIPSVTNDELSCDGRPDKILYDVRSIDYRGKEELIAREAIVSVEFVTLLSAYDDDGWVFKDDQFKSLCHSYFKDAYKHEVSYIERDDYHALVDWLNDNHKKTYVARFLGNDSALVLSDRVEFAYIEVPSDFIERLWDSEGESYYTHEFRRAFSPADDIPIEVDKVDHVIDLSGMKGSFEPICTFWTSKDPPENPSDADLWKAPDGNIYAFHNGERILVNTVPLSPNINIETSTSIDDAYVEQVSEAIDKIMKSKEKENTTMKLPTTNFDFGPVTNGRVALSPYGLAIKTNESWYAYNATTDQTIDVTGFTFDMKGMIYKMPVAVSAVVPGDMILHNGNPMYVVATGGSKLTAVDLVQSEEKTVIPVTNVFNFNFVTKVVSLVNLGTAQPTADQPFGNLMPMMMLSSILGEDGKDNLFGGDNDLMKLMMVSSMMGNNSQNPFGQLFNFGVNTTPAGGGSDAQ